MLKLVVTKLQPLTEQRLVRMMKDTLALGELPLSEVRSMSDTLEVIRDRLSQLLDKVDGKDV